MPITPRIDLLLESFDVALEDAAGWDRSTGDDAPRFALLHLGQAEGLLQRARELLREPGLGADGELGHALWVLEQAASRDRTAARYLRDVVAAARAVGEGARARVGAPEVAGPASRAAIEVPPPGSSSPQAAGGRFPR